MKSIPRTGQSGEQIDRGRPVESHQFCRPADAVGPGDAVADRLSRVRGARCDRPCLEEHERSVGTFVEVEHLAPAPEGFTVTCRPASSMWTGPS